VKRTRWDPTSPEFVEELIQRVRGKTREELLKELAWRPEGAEETWRLQRDGSEAAPLDRPQRDPRGGAGGTDQNGEQPVITPRR
jgi:CubicO group peptidase (beta-lactamase class C family)